MADVQKREGGAVYLLHLKVLVDNDKAAGHVVEHLVAYALGSIHDKRQAHAVIGGASVNGDSLVAAGVVPARTAVKLIRGVGLANPCKYLAYLLFTGCRQVQRRADMIHVQTLGARLLKREILLADVLENRADVSHRRVYVFFHDRAIDAAARTGVHFDKAPVYLAVSYVTQCVHAVFCAVDCYGEIACVRHIHAVCYATCDGEARGSALKAFAEFGFDLDAL